MDLEKKLDKEMLAHFTTRPSDLSPEDWAVMREQHRLSLLYPGKYVAYWSHYRGEGDQLRLVHREVLYASRSLTAVQKRIAALPEERQVGLNLVYVEKPSDPFWL